MDWINNQPDLLQWILLLGFGVVFLYIAPWSNSLNAFFQAKKEGAKAPQFWMLTSSLVISWIFAKSITNAANLGLKFGLVGGVAYAVYYLSFIVGGLIIYQLSVKGGFKSIHEFLQHRHGKTAVVVFSLLIGFRLFNEVWSNTMVIGSYFGAQGSAPYYLSIVAFTGLTLLYTLKGGLRSSLLTDAIQMVFFGVLLFIIFSYIIPQTEGGLPVLLNSGDWTMSGGLNLLFAALLQVFSYPFHDPVLTDRGFISTPKITLKSYCWAAFIGFVCIVVFSLVGVFAQQKGLEGQAAVQVAQLLGVAGMLAMNFIMITSAASTLDSTFSSSAKLVILDLAPKVFQTVSNGRWVMVIITLIGTLPIFANPAILSATTVSGTMVIGLAPPFLLWRRSVHRYAFSASVVTGFVVGLLLAFDLFPQSLVFTNGAYSDLLWANFWGLLLCFAVYLFPNLVLRPTQHR